VQENLVIAKIASYVNKTGLLNAAKMAEDTKKSIKDLVIKTRVGVNLDQSLSAEISRKCSLPLVAHT
jgi:methyl-galactoside transport system ATP-binding protein